MKILIISLSGMGCTLMYTPALRVLRERFPDAKIDCLVRNKAFGEVLTNNKDVDDVIVLQEKGVVSMGLKTLKLMGKRYDISLINFPSRKFSINLFSYLVHAKKRLGHSYNHKFLSTTFLQNRKLKADLNLDDVEQNLNLLKLLGINYNKKDVRTILNSNEGFGDEFLKENKIKGLIIGLHPGSSTDNEMALKRWDLKKFGELCNKLIKENNAKILIFGGPEEIDIKNELNGLINNKGFVVNENLQKTFSLVEKCRLFVTNDSGLMHISVALGVKTIALIGPTSGPTDKNIRTMPYRENHIVIKKDDCKCFYYPFFTSSSKLECNKECMGRITSDEVYDKIKNELRSNSK
tara:strand:- start:239 stop:1288 length:1050 start_codon:yes stop_codon:yes gene_type:complete